MPNLLSIEEHCNYSVAWECNRYRSRQATAGNKQVTLQVTHEKTNSDFQKNKLRFSIKQTPILKKANSDFQKTNSDFWKTNSDFQETNSDFQKTNSDFEKQTPILKKTNSDFQKNKLRFSKNKLPLSINIDVP